MKRKILFVTGTRADFGKLKSIILNSSGEYEILIFATGMHMMTRFGQTWNEVRDLGIGQVFPFVNQNTFDNMPSILSKTIQGLSDFMSESKPDLIIVHGDRVEAMASAVVGMLTGTVVAHIEGGELSGTVDEMIRHAISKISTYHFVSNHEAEKLLLQMGEDPKKIFIVGSPDIDVMLSDKLPTFEDVQHHYNIGFSDYAIAILHPVVTEKEMLPIHAKIFFQTLQASGKKYVVIHPNNDPGHEIILSQIDNLQQSANFRIFPSMRFEYFLTLLKHSQFIIGNSSAGIREAPYFAVPCVNVGTRQRGRSNSNLSINCEFETKDLVSSIDRVLEIPRIPEMNFGTDNCAERILSVMRRETFWDAGTQKIFLKRPIGQIILGG